MRINAKPLPENQSHTISGLNIELDFEYDGDRLVWSKCFISAKRGEFSGSLALLEHTGHLDHHSTSAQLPILPSVINLIGQWARRNGY